MNSIAVLLRLLLVTLFLFGTGQHSWALASDSVAPVERLLVPLPQSVEAGSGQYVPPARIDIVLSDRRHSELRKTGEHAAQMVQQIWQRPANIVHGSSGTGAIRLHLRPAEAVEPESYRLIVAPSGVDITAPTPAGLFYGLQTLRQLAEGSGAQGISAITIEDQPRFGWRGLHLDSARHIQPVAYIKEQLDLMARYKFNRFHWHLTDDQGWRLEIKRYPRLTEIGAWRDETPVGRNLNPYIGDGTRYGGFYTQEQIREIVNYAKERHIEVIPEIDIPGHTVAVLASYPELACTPGPFKVYTTWGVAEDILCPSEESLTFIKNVMLEVIELFPSEYVHLGGDEAPTVRWENSELAQSIIRREGLADEHALQGWFLRQIENFLNERGRKIIGWDEILDGDPAPSATVMSWRGMTGGIAAARKGHDVVMSPNQFAYFDHCQGKLELEPICIGGFLPLQKVYSFDPVPQELTPDEGKRILGGQANLWTEYLKTQDMWEYMLWPRTLALAEVLWTAPERRDWSSFEARLAPQLSTLDRIGVGYRIPDVEGLESDVLTLDPSASVTLRSPLPNAVIRYTTDGSDPTEQSQVYTGPLTLEVDKDGTLVRARPFLGSRAGPLAEARFRQTELTPASAVERGQPGLASRFFEAAVTDVFALDALTPARTDVVSRIGLPEFQMPETFGMIFDGYVTIPSDGIYTFAVQSDDGAVLTIAGTAVVDRNGPQSSGETRGAVALKAGVHPISLRYFQGGGAAALNLKVARQGEPLRDIPADWWSHQT